jgi:hypothetical protein
VSDDRTDDRGDASAAPQPGKWRQRLLFFAAGIASLFVSDKVAHWIPGPTGIIELGIAAGIGVALLVLRVVRGPQWRWLSYFAGLGFVWCGFLAVLLLPSTIENWVRTTSFDASAWRSAELGSSETRVWMVDDLLERPLVGMKAADVDELLGPDDSVRGTGWGQGYWNGWDRVWWLGPERGFMSIDSEWLVLRVDAAGTVTEARLVRD